MENVQKKYIEKIKVLGKKDLVRSLKGTDTRQGKTMRYQGRTCLNLSSNDYLGLSTDLELTARFYKDLDKESMINRFGLSSSSSRLLTGNSSRYEELETMLAGFFCKEAALMFNSGYHANIGMIPALTEATDLILSDSLNHASIVDGIRLSRAMVRIFNHNDMEDLARILEKERSKYQTALIITESVFSMDGDCADIRELVRLKEKYNALLYIDEAHSVGVYGANGQGLCFEMALHDRVDIILCPMGKALASHGAFSLTSQVLKDYLVNTARSLLYTTALPPVVVSWNLFVITQMKTFEKKRENLSMTSRMFRNALENKDICIVGESHIIPVITHSNRKAVALSNMLIDHGFIVFPIRPPTVAENLSRIRFSLTSDIEYEDIKTIPDIIQSYLNG